jgi:hypothetical protein
LKNKINVSGPAGLGKSENEPKILDKPLANAGEPSLKQR